MQIISEKIDGKIEAVLYDEDGRVMMVLPSHENEDGEREFDVPDSILNTMARQEKGEDIRPLELKDAERKVQNYKAFGDWESPDDEWINVLPSQHAVVITETDIGPVEKLLKWVDIN